MQYFLLHKKDYFQCMTSESKYPCFQVNFQTPFQPIRTTHRIYIYIYTYMYVCITHQRCCDSKHSMHIIR